MQEEVYTITDIFGYVSQVREAAAKTLSNDYKNDNLDDYISLQQMQNLVLNECIGFDEEKRPILDETANENVFEKTITWIHNVGLAKLASQNLIECAWDSEINAMVFWIKS